MAETSGPEVLRILVVEDDRDLLDLFGNFFHMIPNNETRMSATSEDAVALLDGGFAPAVALVDFNLGGGHTSVELCGRIHRQCPGCLLFIMSGHVAREQICLPPDVQVERFIEKPFHFPDLIEAITSALKSGRPRSLGLTRWPVAGEGQIGTLRGLLEQAPDDVSVRHLLAFSLYTAGRYRESLEEYEAVGRKGYRTFLSEYYAGHTHARLRRYDEAVRHWSLSLALAPSDRVASKVRRRIEQGQGLLEAEKDLQADLARPEHDLT